MAGTAEGAAKARAAREARLAAEPQAALEPQVTEEEPQEAPKPQDAAQERLEARFGARVRVTREVLHYVVTRRPLKNGEGLLRVGEVVPGAEAWPRVEAWVRAGLIKPVYAEDDLVA